jgi:hypothetical protein
MPGPNSKGKSKNKNSKSQNLKASGIWNFNFWPFFPLCFLHEFLLDDIFILATVEVDNDRGSDAER